MKEDIYIFSQYMRPEYSVNIPLAGISYCDNTYLVHRADYNHYVIEYTLEGEGCLETQEQCYTLQPGDTYFLYKGRGHRYYCSGKNWIKLWVVLDGEVAEALFGIYLKDKPNVLHGFDIQRNMQSILSLVRNKQLPYEEMVNQIILIVHRILIAAKSHPQPSSLTLPEIIKNHIDENLNQPLSLEELSTIFHYSKNHIINTFYRAYGYTPYDYYQTQRLQSARELLMGTSASVSSIALRLGFDSPQYFSKRFRKQYGVTPMQFRSNIMKQ